MEDKQNGRQPFIHSFIKTPNNHNNELTNGEQYNTTGRKPLDMKEENPALMGR